DMSPTLTPYAPYDIVHQDGLDWDSLTISGTTTITHGVLAPDGTPTATRISVNNANPEDPGGVTFSDLTIPLAAAGDWLIHGGWARSSAGKTLEGAGLFINFNNVTLDNGTNDMPTDGDGVSMRIVSGWTAVNRATKVTSNPGGANQHLTMFAQAF